MVSRDSSDTAAAGKRVWARHEQCTVRFVSASAPSATRLPPGHTGRAAQYAMATIAEYPQ
ncbi:hypothetical protein NO135_23440 [Clostridioides difficile]|nr:hypothetical protein [Clostridioides difficile]